jgi:hypothetical protein
VGRVAGGMKRLRIRCNVSEARSNSHPSSSNTILGILLNLLELKEGVIFRNYESTAYIVFKYKAS